MEGDWTNLLSLIFIASQSDLFTTSAGNKAELVFTFCAFRHYLRRKKHILVLNAVSFPGLLSPRML